MSVQSHYDEGSFDVSRTASPRPEHSCGPIKTESENERTQEDSHTPHDGSDHNSSFGKRKATRRSVACKSCHSLKVKCTPADANNPAGSCIRCLNSRRKCEIDLNQPRKRRRKSERAPANGDPSSNDNEKTPSSAVSSGREGSDHHLDTTTTTNAITDANVSADVNATANANADAPKISDTHEPTSHTTKLTTSAKVSKKDQLIMNLQSQIESLQRQLNQDPQPHPRSTQSGKQPLPTQSSNSHNPYPGSLPHYLPPHTRSDSVASSDLGSPVFVSKYDLEKEIVQLCESTTSSLSDLTNYLKASADRRLQLMEKSHAIDVVSKGLISSEQAEERLRLYRTIFYTSHPLVEVPWNINADQFRHNQPYLFNAVMCVTNAVIKNDIDSDQTLRLDNEAISAIANEVLVVGSKSVELIKSLLLLCLWYNTPELFRNRRYHLLNTISVTLLHDVGIIARPSFSFKNSEGSICLDEGSSGFSLEHASLIMILYFTTVSICLILRRAVYVKWTPYVEECCTRLQNSGVEKWTSLATFSRLSHQLERIHHIIHSPDTKDRAGHASRYVLSELQKNLSVIKDQIPSKDYAFLAYYYSVEAYLHEPILSEIVTKSENGEDNDDSVRLNTATIVSIGHCTTSCLNALDNFTCMTSEEIAAIPLFYASRIIYTAGMLLRLRYLILSLPSHIEKDLVPRQAVLLIQKLNGCIDKAITLHPANHFLKKLSLVLQLFVQTYATQVQDLLEKNGETPQNFVPANIYRFPKRELNELEKLTQMYKVTHSGGLITTDSGQSYGSQVPLDLLSYAATCRREGRPALSPSYYKKNEHEGTAARSPLASVESPRPSGEHQAVQPQNSNERSTSTKGHKIHDLLSPSENPHSPQKDPSPVPNKPTHFPIPNLNTGIPKSPNYVGPILPSPQRAPVPLATNGFLPPDQSMNFSTGVDMVGNPMNQEVPKPQIPQPIPTFNNNKRLMTPQSFLDNTANTFNQSTAHLMPPPHQVQPLVAPSPSAFQQPGVNNNNGIANANSPSQLTKHLANPDQLENSYLALNDEFWVNLLSADSDKLNFTNNSNSNFNGEEVFFMN